MGLSRQRADALRAWSPTDEHHAPHPGIPPRRLRGLKPRFSARCRSSPSATARCAWSRAMRRKPSSSTRAPSSRRRPPPTIACSPAATTAWSRSPMPTARPSGSPKCREGGSTMLPPVRAAPSPTPGQGRGRAHGGRRDQDAGASPLGRRARLRAEGAACGGRPLRWRRSVVGGHRAAADRARLEGRPSRRHLFARRQVRRLEHAGECAARLEARRRQGTCA